MIGGGGVENSAQPPPPPPSSNGGGEFLLQLLRNPTPQPPPPPPQQPPSQTLSHDPAVAAVGPTLPYPPSFQSNGHDLRPPPFAPHNFFHQSFPQNPNPNLNPSHLGWPVLNRNNHHNLQNFQFSSPQSSLAADDIRQKLGFLGPTPRPDLTHQREQSQSLMFGSLPCKIQSQGSAKPREPADGNSPSNGFDHTRNSPGFVDQNRGENSRGFQNLERQRRDEGGGDGGGGGGWGRHPPGMRRPPPGFPSQPSGFGNRSVENNNVDKKGKTGFGELSHRGTRGAVSNHEDEREKRLFPELGGNIGDVRVGHGKNRGDTRVVERRLSSQLDSPGPPGGSSLHSVSASEIEESMAVLHFEVGENGVKPGYRLRDDVRRGGGGRPVGSLLDGGVDEELGSLVLEDGSDEKNSRKGHRSFRDKVLNFTLWIFIAFTLVVTFASRYKRHVLGPSYRQVGNRSSIWNDVANIEFLQ